MEPLEEIKEFEKSPELIKELYKHCIKKKLQSRTCYFKRKRSY